MLYSLKSETSQLKNTVDLGQRTLKLAQLVHGLALAVKPRRGDLYSQAGALLEHTLTRERALPGRGRCLFSEETRRNID